MTFMKRYYYTFGSEKRYQGIKILEFNTPLFRFKWFTDCGDWFIYIITKSETVYRFGSAGYMKF